MRPLSSSEKHSTFGHKGTSLDLAHEQPCKSSLHSVQAARAIQDLEEAIVLEREALDLRPQGHPLRSTSLNNLATSLSTRFKQLVAVDDLHEAIVLFRYLRPRGRPLRSGSLNNLADSLFTRYNQLGAMEDLHEAIVLDREALDLRPQGHPDRPISLNNPAKFLSTRCNQLEATEDVGEAIVLGREALGLCLRGPRSLLSLALHLCDQFTESR